MGVSVEIFLRWFFVLFRRRGGGVEWAFTSREELPRGVRYYCWVQARTTGRTDSNTAAA